MSANHLDLSVATALCLGIYLPHILVDQIEGGLGVLLRLGHPESVLNLPHEILQLGFYGLL